MIIQEILFTYENIQHELKNSRNIFTKIKLKKQLRRLFKYINKVEELDITYDILNEFMILYNGTYDIIEIPKTIVDIDDKYSRLTVDLDTLLFQITLSHKEINGISLSINYKDKDKLPDIIKLYKELKYDGDIEHNKNVVDLIHNTVRLVIFEYIIEYIKKKEERI